MKTLRVCHSSELPTIQDRDINYIYYLYDKLEVFMGRNYYSDPYAIVETYPFDNAIPSMLYFCLDDGFVRARINLEDKEIAQIESQEQLDILKQAGTTFFVNADRRYLDVKTKCISLPFANGTYELTVSLASDLKINSNTVIGFNEETQEFEIIGDIQDYDLVFSRNYKGKDTYSANTKVEDHKISTNVKVSALEDNIIKATPSGLYATVNDRVPSNIFEDWVERFKTYKEDMAIFIEELADLIEEAEEIISSDSIARKIHEALLERYPTIDEDLANFDEYAEKIDGLYDYANEEFEEIEAEIDTKIDGATNEPWENF